MIYKCSINQSINELINIQQISQLMIYKYSINQSINEFIKNKQIRLSIEFISI